MSSVVVAGDVSGSCTLQAPSAAGSTVLTLPVIATDTLAGIAATQTLTNKTLTSPVLTTPALGTPASGVLTNCTGVVAGALPAGSVLQVVNAVYATQVSSATNTPVNTGLTATITPLFSTSKILVLVNQSGLYKSAANTANAIDIILLRGATNICSFISNAGVTSTLLQVNVGSGSTCYLDSPATTSATIYKTQFFSTSNTATVYVQANNDTSTITLMEIRG